VGLKCRAKFNVGLVGLGFRVKSHLQSVYNVSLETNDNNNIISNSLFSGNFRQKEKFIFKK